jgi:thymidylate synthase ThyX
MAYACHIELDSVGPSGDRLTTFVVTYPRFVHSELLTHRMLSRNSSSSRAIPIEKMIEQVMSDPVLPVWWGKNQKGMQAREELIDEARAGAESYWLAARDEAVLRARMLHGVGLHKQIVNRLLEPWMWITVIVSATEWDNFFKLRCHPDAQPEIRRIAEMMQEAYKINVPTRIDTGGWHLPFIQAGDGVLTFTKAKKISTARCARVSYLTHDGRRDFDEDVKLHDQLKGGSGVGHWSPFEHVAMAMATPRRSGNFIGWTQYREEAERRGEP